MEHGLYDSDCESRTSIHYNNQRNSSEWHFLRQVLQKTHSYYFQSIINHINWHIYQFLCPVSFLWSQTFYVPIHHPQVFLAEGQPFKIHRIWGNKPILYRFLFIVPSLWSEYKNLSFCSYIPSGRFLLPIRPWLPWYKSF